MDRLLIDDKVKKCAAAYEQAFRAYKFDVPQELRDIKAQLDQHNGINGLLQAELDQYKDYLEEIANDYDNADPIKNLLVLQPKEFESLIKKYEDPHRFGLVKLDKDLVYRIQAGGKNKGKRYKKNFWGLIVDAMHYEKYVRPIMVPLIEALGIRTCVYCNLQYALTINHSEGLFELDHRYPKSKYPYLCTTFYNLQPSCPTCNHGKKDDTADFGLYTDNPSELHPFHLLTTPQLYLRKRRLDGKYLNIRLVASKAKDAALCQLAASHESDFQINSTYAVVKDVAEETIWRCKAFDDTYKELFVKNFPELYSKDALHRFVFGVYSDDNNVHQRPLTKLKRDIMKDMGVVISE
ncbi:MAG: HNH endonuclease [Alloprevotella sp.]